MLLSSGRATVPSIRLYSKNKTNHPRVLDICSYCPVHGCPAARVYAWCQTLGFCYVGTASCIPWQIRLTPFYAHSGTMDWTSGRTTTLAYSSPSSSPRPCGSASPRPPGASQRLWFSMDWSGPGSHYRRWPFWASATSKGVLLITWLSLWCCLMLTWIFYCWRCPSLILFAWI